MSNGDISAEGFNEGITGARQGVPRARGERNVRNLKVTREEWRRGTTSGGQSPSILVCMCLRDLYSFGPTLLMLHISLPKSSACYLPDMRDHSGPITKA